MHAVLRVLLGFFAHFLVVLSLTSLFIQPVQAGLPDVEPPSSGSKGGLMATLKGHIQDGLIVLGLVVAAVAFLVVANAAITTFHEVREGKANWGKFGAIIVVGIVLLVAVIWLVGKSAEILT